MNRRAINETLSDLTRTPPNWKWGILDTALVFFVGTLAGRLIDFVPGIWALVGVVVGVASIGLIRWFAWRACRENQFRGWRIEEEQRKRPREGLMVVLGPYRGPDLPASLTDLADEDFEALLMDKRCNIRPPIEAIRYHAHDNTLDHLYALYCPCEDKAALMLDVITEWVRRHHGIAVKVHPEPITSLEYDDTVKAVEQILRTCPLTHNQMICDITGGKKPMSIAVAGTAASFGVDLQYGEGARKEDGEPDPSGPFKIEMFWPDLGRHDHSMEAPTP